MYSQTQGLFQIVFLEPEMLFQNYYLKYNNRTTFHKPGYHMGFPLKEILILFAFLNLLTQDISYIFEYLYND